MSAKLNIGSLTRPVFPIMLTCTFLFCKAIAQPSVFEVGPVFKITGSVMDSALAVMMPNVSIAVYDSTMLILLATGMTDENGLFNLQKVPVTACNITFTHIGYKSRTVKFNSTAATVNIGTIPLITFASSLPLVKVINNKPLIEQFPDKLVYNLEADPEIETAMLLEVLRKVPMVSMDAEDKIRLNGSLDYKILINGMPSSLLSGNPTDVFWNFPANAVKSIEIITIPGSRFQANGLGGIINIVTNKGNLNGYNGALTIKATDPEGYSFSGNTSANFGKVSISGLYGYNDAMIAETTTDFFRQDNNAGNTLKQSGVNSGRNKSQNWTGEAAWQLNPLNSITVSYGMNDSKANTKSLDEILWNDRENNVAKSYFNLGSGTVTSDGKDLTFDFQRVFKSNEARQLNIAYRLSESNTISARSLELVPLLNFVKQKGSTANTDFFNEQLFQVDYVQPISKHSLELGISANRQENKSDFSNMTLKDNQYVLDSSQSNVFYHTQDIYSAYVSMKFLMGKWLFKAGARNEWTNVDAVFATNGTHVRQQYQFLIPNVTLSRRFRGISTINLSYTQRLTRPDLYYLDPYIDISDPLNISHGNPNLETALSHVINLSLNWVIRKTSITLDGFHQFSNNSIQQVTTLTDSVSETTFNNIGKNKSTTASLNFNTTVFKRLVLYYNSSATYSEYRGVSKTQSETRNGITYNVGGSAQLRFKTWGVNSTMQYSAPLTFAQGTVSSYTTLTSGFNKYLFKKKLNVTVSVVNPAHKYRKVVKEIKDPGFYMANQTVVVSRRFNAAISYRFSKIQTGRN